MNTDKIDLKLGAHQPGAHAHNTARHAPFPVKRASNAWRKDRKDTLMRLHRLLRLTGVAPSPRVLKRLLVRPAPPLVLKERHLFAAATWLCLQGDPRGRRSALLRSTANHVCHQLPSPVINNEIIASANSRRSLTSNCHQSCSLTILSQQ